MSTNPPATFESGGPTIEDTALETEMYELATRYPEFDFKEVAGDAQWFYDRLARGEYRDLAGKVVAVIDREVVGVGNHETRMRVELCRKYNRHPGRFYLTYVPGENESF